MKIDLNKYKEFVDAVTSDESKSNDAFTHNWASLNNQRMADMPRLLTASCGMGAEAGEFTEVVKKILFQGKPYTEDNVFHMKRELGDICWYLAQAFMALDTDFDEILDMNIEKLSARYPAGTFDSYYSENRVEGDV